MVFRPKSFWSQLLAPREGGSLFLFYPRELSGPDRATRSNREYSGYSSLLLTHILITATHLRPLWKRRIKAVWVAGHTALVVAFRLKGLSERCGGERCLVVIWDGVEISLGIANVLEWVNIAPGILDLVADAGIPRSPGQVHRVSWDRIGHRVVGRRCGVIGYSGLGTGQLCFPNII